MLQPRTTNCAEAFNSCINRACPNKVGFWRVVDILHMYALVVEKQVKEVKAGRVPEKRNNKDCRDALTKMKQMRDTMKFDLGMEDMLEAMAKFSETDWTGKEMEFNKNFEDADAAFEAEDDADLSDSE
jgi:hypothetical protein